MSLRILDSLHADIARRSPNLVPGACLAMAIILVCSMDFTQLLLALLGALMYALLSLPASGFKRPSSKGQMLKQGFPNKAPLKKTSPAGKPSQAGKPSPPASLTTKPSKEATTGHGEVRQLSWNPVLPVQFSAVGWDAEVDELVGKILPSAASQKIVQHLSGHVKSKISEVFPDVDVTSFTFSDLMRNTAFGVAVPEVDIVLCLKPNSLHNIAHSRSQQRGSISVEDRLAKFKKTAIRACTEKLVNDGGFKFRRSAFRGEEPKVTLLVPAALGFHIDSIPIDLFVNSTTPMHHTALLTECGRLDPRAQALALLVRRWAKDRGICHAAKGHLCPYAWTLMTIYFLQVGMQGQGPILPPVKKFAAYSDLAKQPDAGAASMARPSEPDAGDKSLGQLLREFFDFYAQGFDFRKEAICVRLGERSAPGVTLPLNIVLHSDGVTTDVAPSIEDPFDRRHNVGSNLGEYGLLRLRDELARADRLCSAAGTSLSELLEPWAPPIQNGEAHADAAE